MYQRKSRIVKFETSQDALQRMQALADALIEERVPSGHELLLQADGYPDLPIGRWGAEDCSPQDLELAQAVLIRW